MSLGKYLKKELVNLGNVSREDIVDFSLGLREDIPYKVQYIAVSCGCTKIISTKEEIDETGIINGQITIANAGVGEDAGEYRINRTMTVYFNDGKDEFIANENLMKKANPEKALERFTITGLGIVPELEETKEQ